MRKKIQSIKNWVSRNNKILMPVSLILGFFVDSVTLYRVDRSFENIVFISYLFFAIVGIFFSNYFRDKVRKNSLTDKVYLFSPFIIQFMFGGLFSGFAVFYLRSGSISSSWFFILILLVLMVGNDIFKKRYEHFVFQITIFFTGLFFYLIFAVPVILNILNARVFLISGFFSITIVFFILYIFSLFLFEDVKKSFKHITLSVASVFVFINILYFANVIPPIPLSLKTGDIYHSVEKISGGYKVFAEPQNRFFNFNKTIHIAGGGSVYAFSSVFSPADINTTIVHEWQYFDSDKKTWESASKISFPIVGGRDMGYRGYSYKTNLKEGDWRVLVETVRGQVIGKISFKIVYTETVPPLEEKVL